MPTVYLDGSPVVVSGEARIVDLVPDKPDDVSIAVIRPATVRQAETRQYLCKTTGGEIVIETHGDDAGILSVISSGIGGGWNDLHIVSFGPFPSSISPSRRPSRYSRGDVILGCGGYDPDRSYLLFCKKTHSADHGSGPDGSIIGTVVSGLGIMDRLVSTDKILSIEPVISFAESSEAFTTTDMTLPLDEGMHIITHMRIEATGYRPGSISTDAASSVESMLLAFRNNRFAVDHRMSNHIRCDIIAPAVVFEEVRTPRREGAVLMRTSGKKRGAVYIYTQDLPRSMAHTTVGQVVHGIELARIAREKDRFRVVVTPEKCDLIGLSVSDARDQTAAAGITIHGGEAGAESVVIAQDPENTLEILARGEVTVQTVPYSRVIDISLDDADAPVTCRIFREVTGLKYRDIGMLPMMYAFDEVFLFGAKIPKTTNVNPEHTPDGEVPPNMLAMTNDSCRGTGTVGIRTVASSEFGPTSEPFSGTNIMGRVHNPGVLSSIKDGEKVYFREIKE